MSLLSRILLRRGPSLGTDLPRNVLLPAAAASLVAVRLLFNEPPSKAKKGELETDRKQGQPKQGENLVATEVIDSMLSNEEGDGKPVDRTKAPGESTGMRKGPCGLRQGVFSIQMAYL